LGVDSNMVCLVAQSVSEGMFGHWQMSKRFRRVLLLGHFESANQTI
jgi:hypothetical protein